MRQKAEGVQFLVRVPPDLMQWVENEAKRNRSTQASEIVRALCDRQDAEQRRRVA
jgi:hypothetical protein